MKLLLLHDHKFRKIGNDYYSTGCFSDSVLSWYQNLFEDVEIVGRIIEEKVVSPRYSKIINDNVKVSNKKHLKQKVKEADCIIARLPSINGYRGLHFARKYKKQYFVEVVGCTLDAYWNYSLLGKLLAVPAYLVMRHYVKKADYVSYVTSSFLQKRYPNKNNHLSASDVQLAALDKTILETRKIKNNGRLILGTAAPVDVKYKGQKYVIDALALLKQKNVVVEYHMAGSGNKDYLQTLATKKGVADMVFFDGLINHQRMDEWYDSLDVYVHPSLLEGMSRAILEAMSRCLPCVANNCGGNFEVICNDLLVDKKKGISKQIAECIQRLDNKEYYNLMCDYSYGLIKQSFDANEIDKKRKAFYSQYKKAIYKA